MLSNKGLEINAKCPHQGVIVPKALHRADSSGMRSAERRKVNVIELKYLRSLVGVSLMDKIWNEEVRRKARIAMKVVRIREYRDGLDTWRG